MDFFNNQDNLVVDLPNMATDGCFQPWHFEIEIPTSADLYGGEEETTYNNYTTNNNEWEMLSNDDFGSLADDAMVASFLPDLCLLDSEDDDDEPLHQGPPDTISAPTFPILDNTVTTVDDDDDDFTASILCPSLSPQPIFATTTLPSSSSYSCSSESPTRVVSRTSSFGTPAATIATTTTDPALRLAPPMTPEAVELDLEFKRRLKKLANSMRRSDESRNLVKRQRSYKCGSRTSSSWSASCSDGQQQQQQQQPLDDFYQSTRCEEFEWTRKSLLRAIQTNQQF